MKNGSLYSATFTYFSVNPLGELHVVLYYSSSSLDSIFTLLSVCSINFKFNSLCTSSHLYYHPHPWVQSRSALFQSIPWGSEQFPFLVPFFPSFMPHIWLLYRGVLCFSKIVKMKYIFLLFIVWFASFNFIFLSTRWGKYMNTKNKTYNFVLSSVVLWYFILHPGPGHHINYKTCVFVSVFLFNLFVVVLCVCKMFLLYLSCGLPILNLLKTKTPF